jgi:hypothetical protein
VGKRGEDLMREVEVATTGAGRRRVDHDGNRRQRAGIVERGGRRAGDGGAGQDSAAVEIRANADGEVQPAAPIARRRW